MVLKINIQLLWRYDDDGASLY